MTCLSLTNVVGLYGCEFLWTIDGFVVEDAVQLEGEFERGDVDVEFAVDGVFVVEVELKIRVEFWQLGGEPDFELGGAGALGLVGVVPLGGAG